MLVPGKASFAENRVVFGLGADWVAPDQKMGKLRGSEAVSEQTSCSVLCVQRENDSSTRRRRNYFSHECVRAKQGADNCFDDSPGEDSIFCNLGGSSISVKLGCVIRQVVKLLVEGFNRG